LNAVCNESDDNDDDDIIGFYIDLSGRYIVMIMMMTMMMALIL